MLSIVEQGSLVRMLKTITSLLETGFCPNPARNLNRHALVRGSEEVQTREAQVYSLSISSLKLNYEREWINP